MNVEFLMICLLSPHLIKLLIPGHVIINPINQEHHDSLSFIFDSFLINFLSDMFHRSRKLFLFHPNSISPCWLSILVEQLFSLLLRQLKITQMAEFHEVIVNYHLFALVGVWDKMENRWPNLQGQNTGFLQLEQCILRTQTARNLCNRMKQKTFCTVHILRSNTNRLWRLFLSHSHTHHLVHLIKVLGWKQRLSLFFID